MNLNDQIELLKGMDLDQEVFETMERAASFHGHICPGLAVGVAASIALLKCNNRSEDEQIVAVVENDACGVDGIQLLLGCTFGKGNLIFKDHGKSVYTFYLRGPGKAYRYSLKEMPGFEKEGTRELIDRVRSGLATEHERIRYQEIWVKRAAEVLRAGESLFDIREVDPSPPPRARMYDSISCIDCGEHIGSHRVVDTEEGPLCLPCSAKKEAG